MIVPVHGKNVPGALDMSWQDNKQSDDLCMCPCHKEGLECHACYVVECGVVRLEAEIRRVVHSE